MMQVEIWLETRTVVVYGQCNANSTIHHGQLEFLLDSVEELEIYLSLLVAVIYFVS